MFPDLLLNTHNLGPEVSFTPHNVTYDIQIESVEMGETRERNQSANVNQVWNAAAAIVTPPVHFLQLFQLSSRTLDIQLNNNNNRATKINPQNID